MIESHKYRARKGLRSPVSSHNKDYHWVAGDFLFLFLLFLWSLSGHIYLQSKKALASIFFFIDNTWYSTKAWRTQNGAVGTERETTQTSSFSAVETSNYNSAKNSVNNIASLKYIFLKFIESIYLSVST